MGLPCKGLGCEPESKSDKDMLKALISLGGLGFFLSTILAIAYAKLAIKVSLKEKQILDALPGLNCGACGFAGCEGYAASLAKGGTEIGLCPVGGAELVNKLSEFLGVEAKEVEPKVTVIRCSGGENNTEERLNYVGLQSCIGARLVAGGPKSCLYGCLGFGDCVLVCKFDAIRMGDDGLPLINDKLCTGCGMCVDACPQNIIELIPKVEKVYVKCSSPESARLTKLHCKVGCIGCKLCEKNCPYDAIKVEDGVARINFEFCENCGICVHKCPTGAIFDKLRSRPKAMIGTNCTGCEKCKEVCPMNAISGETGEQHKVDFSKCIGCNLCYKICKEEAITMAFSLGYSEV